MHDQDLLTDLIINKKYIELDEIIKSDIEMYFLDKIISFGWLAYVKTSPSQDKCISIDFELCFGYGHIFFSLHLSKQCGAVNIIHITQNFSSQPLSEKDFEKFLEKIYINNRNSALL